MTLKFTVPLPPRALSSNGNKGGSWRKKANATKDYRFLVKLSTPMALRKTADCVRLSLTFCTREARATGDYAPRDAANALSAFKAGIDGLVDAGMCPDDSAKHLELGAILIDSTRGPFVEVQVEALP